MIDVFRFFLSLPRRYCFPHWSCFVVISSHLHLCIEFGYSDCVNDQCLASLLTYFRLFWSRVASFQRINFTDVAYVMVPAYPGCPGKMPLNGCSSSVVEWDQTNDIHLSSIHLGTLQLASGTHTAYGITQCYLPPGRADIATDFAFCYPLDRSTKTNLNPAKKRWSNKQS